MPAASDTDRTATPAIAHDRTELERLAVEAVERACRAAGVPSKITDRRLLDQLAAMFTAESRRPHA